MNEEEDSHIKALKTNFIPFLDLLKIYRRYILLRCKNEFFPFKDWPNTFSGHYMFGRIDQFERHLFALKWPGTSFSQQRFNLSIIKNDHLFGSHGQNRFFRWQHSTSQYQYFFLVLIMVVEYSIRDKNKWKKKLGTESIHIQTIKFPKRLIIFSEVFLYLKFSLKFVNW